ncbi:kinase-like domain-containing protein, partial [Rhizophagus diaphanus]
FGNFKLILKKLENVESANQSWFEEAKSHLTISNKWAAVVRCYGLTQNPSNGNYMLVMNEMDIDLRKYLQQNHNQLTWKERINITYEIILALSYIHYEKAIHRDLHSGNILYSQLNDYWYISDLGFCGPADKSSTSIYGNLPYIAPEVIIGREYTFASDIYCIAILIPKIVQGTPLEYKNLMKEYYQNMSDDELFKSEKDNSEMNKLEENYTSSRLFRSKIHNFGYLPEPRNATE